MSENNILRSGSGVTEITLKVPVIKGTIPAAIAQKMLDAGYVKARAVVVYPSMQDRQVVCQGVVNPTMYTDNHRGVSGGEDAPIKDMFAQSSWFFRPKEFKNLNTNQYIYRYDVNTPSSADESAIDYMNNFLTADADPNKIQRAEIQGHYYDYNKFKVTWGNLTFHSPDVEFDDNMLTLDYSADSLSCAPIGEAVIQRTMSDIDIQTETPPISEKGSGFLKRSYTRDSPDGIISGLFWDDFPVDDWLSDDGDERAKNEWFGPYSKQASSVRWMVYLWNKNGSLNNDIDRPVDAGVRSAILKRKIISNLRFSNKTTWKTAWSKVVSSETVNFGGTFNIHLFSSDQNEILKLKTDNTNWSNIYRGNIDTLLSPDETDGMYFTTDSSRVATKTYYQDNVDNSWGIYLYDGNSGWNLNSGDIGDDYRELVLKKNPVRMKYKSTPHLVLYQNANSGDSIYSFSLDENSLPVFELRRSFDNQPIYGGDSDDALKEHNWIPCGEPVKLKNLAEDPNTHEMVQQDVTYEYSWGDTYYQRYDCLKTYAYTPEDINQVVEIGSFMLETYVNIDGRYDRNRGQLSNIYMSPQNFNLINPVYSQLNNFFTYRIQDSDAYKQKFFPNQITWSKAKTSGADVDLWTNVTLASTLELDGDKGRVRKLTRMNDQIFCFQDKGVSQVLYNDNVQISSNDGVPIEIANSGKVMGKKYFSDSIGCSNKWSIVQTPSGIYFMDSINKAIFLFNGQFNNISGSLGFNAWAKNNIPSGENTWTPTGFSDFVSYYDKLNQDVLFINSDTALAYSEKLGAFTSFYDYGGTPYFCNLQDTGIWIRNSYSETVEGSTVNHHTALWKHNAGNYCTFFGTKKPFSMTLVGNPEPQMDKIFTNLEFRACVDGDGSLNDETGKFTPTLPFASLETWNEYQHGMTALENKNGHAAMQHGGSSSALKRKFRIWRCDIPRNNYPLETYPVRAEGETEAHYEERIAAYNTWLAGETDKGISRHIRKPNDRMRNPWLYLKLAQNAADADARTEIHDVVMTYFG